MKIEEVPQDPKAFKQGDQLKKLVYATDADGNYSGITSAGWEVENFAMKNAWDLVDDRLAETARKVKQGELSPIAYFMEKSLMDVALLSKYVGKWAWQVKRHLKPRYFAKLKPPLIEKYARIFNITSAQLLDFGKRVE